MLSSSKYAASETFWTELLKIELKLIVPEIQASLIPNVPTELLPSTYK